MISSRYGMVAILIALMLSAPAVDSYAQSNRTLACVPAPADDGAPWEHNTRVLESFPPDNPVPRFLGSFADAASTYRLHMWRDAKGLFGELLSPLLDADSPTSRLYEPRFDAASGTVAFVVHFPPEQWAFRGVLRSKHIERTLPTRDAERGRHLAEASPRPSGTGAARIHHESRAVRLLYDPFSPVLNLQRDHIGHLSHDVAALSFQCDRPYGVAVEQGGDEAEALLDLWTTLTDRAESADATAFVAQAYHRRTGRLPDGCGGDQAADGR